MAFIEWDDSLSVGVELIDNQHKAEVELLNKLHEATGDNILKIFKELADHTVMHFRTEEEYFDKFCYENRDVHKVTHKTFLDKAGEIGKKLEAGETLDEETLIYIKDWLINHIKFMDKKYTQCFNENGLS